MNQSNTIDIGQLDITPFPQSFSDSVGVDNNKDFYTFQLQSDSRVILNLNGLSQDANLFLTNKAKTFVLSSTNVDDLEEFIDAQLPSGNYSVLVRSSTGIDTDYNLSLEIHNDIVTSDPAVSLPDPEFNQQGFKVAWQDEDNSIWMSPVNQQTGELMLSEKVLIDTDVVPRSFTLQGPEWVINNTESEILYTKFVNGDYYIVRAGWNSNEWEKSIITETKGGVSAVGTRLAGDENPLIRYFIADENNPQQYMAWLDVNNPANGGIVPGTADGKSRSARFVEGERSITYTSPVNGTRQVFKYDVDTDTLTQLTFDPLAKGITFMWRAPEFDNELVFFSLERGNNEDIADQLGIYREIDGIWTKINTITPPTGKLEIRSPEPFVYNNKSYISFSAVDFKNGSGSIWIVGVDPNINFAREVSNPEVELVRNDPESLITDTGVYVYYTEKDGNREITHLADTGLGLPLQNNTHSDPTDPILVSQLNTSLPDPEFDWQGNRVTWQDNQGNLWVADIDPETGVFGLLDPQTGYFTSGLEIVYQQSPIDSNLTPINAGAGSRNGPEWIYTQNGANIIYTKYDDQNTRFVGMAEWDGNVWNAGFLNDETDAPIEGYYPIGTVNPNDDNPVIGYILNDSKQRVWRELNNIAVGGDLPETAGRWVQVPDYDGVVTILRDPNTGLNQYYIYDIYTEELTQITNDNFLKIGSGFMWYNPQYDSLFFMSSENNGGINPDHPKLSQRDQIGIYQNIEGIWTRVKTINSPAIDQSYIHSVEPFVYDEKSYLSMVTLNEQNERGIWIVEINLEQNLSYEVNTEGLVGTLNDPETYINDENGFIYYTVTQSDGTRNIYKNDLETIIDDSFVPNDVVVSNPNVSLPDPEFDLVNYYVTWQTFDNKLYVAKVDPVTGDLILNEGSGELLDTNLVPIFSLADGSGTGNGSEFVYTKRGSEILYSKVVNRDGGEKWDLGIATLTKNGWEAGLLEGGQNAFSPIGSLDPYDSSPQVWGLLRTPENPTGIDPKIGSWLNIDDISQTGKLPFEPTSGGRFIAGENSFVITTRIDGVNQVVKYDTDTETTTQLTFDDQFTKDDPFMWQAPEYDNELVFFAKKKIIDPEATKDQKGYRSIGVYRQIDGEWVEFKTIESPSPDKPFIESPEFFVYNGKSYVFFLVDNSRGEKTETDLWLVGIDEDVDFYRQLDDPNLQIIGSDPEYIITENGAFVYYSEIANNQQQTRIIHRTDTGLGLPEDQVLQGTNDNDTLIGSAGKDRISGRNGNDLLSGGANDDILIGGNGNDELFGNHGNDELIGVGNTDLGSNSIDILTGGEGFDIFVLGNENSIFYANNRRRDLARITDFNLDEDTIRLKGSFNQYSAKNTPMGSILFVKETGEEIALLENIKAGDLNQSNFTFV